MIQSQDPLLQPSALQNLKFYRYSAVNKSPLTKYVLRHYWDAAVTVFPMSMAPNLITLCGLGFILINIFTLAAFIPDLIGPGPSWVYYSFAIGLFLYQTFDNVDGRQARRTGSSSALGHIFDHTIDTLNTPLGGLIQAACLGVGHSPRGLFMLMAGLWPMWLSTWEEYYTGTLYLGYINGPDEGLLIACCVHLMTGYFGPGFWKTPIVLLFSQSSISPQIQVIDVFLCFVVFAVFILHAPACLYNVFKSSREKKTFTFSSALYQNIPFLLYNLLALSWILSPHSALISNARGRSKYSGGLLEFTLLITFTFGRLNPRLILARLTKAPFPWFNFGSFVPLVVGSLLVNLRFIGIHITGMAVIERIYLRLAVVYTLLSFVRWFGTLCQKFTLTLNIGCLTIQRSRD